jgi:hypothetical protein
METDISHTDFFFLSEDDLQLVHKRCALKCQAFCAISHSHKAALAVGTGFGWIVLLSLKLNVTTPTLGHGW